MILPVAFVSAGARLPEPRPPFSAMELVELDATRAVICGVVADNCPLANVFTSPEENVASRAAIIEAATAYDVIAQEAFALGETLPVRFGAAFVNLQAAAAALRSDKASQAAWTRLAKTEEWRLSVDIHHETAGASPDDAAPGAYLMRKAAARATRLNAGRVLEETAEAIDAFFAAEPPMAFTPLTRSPGGLKTSVLVRRDPVGAQWVSAFADRLQHEQTQSAPALAISLSGPTPPYGFLGEISEESAVNVGF